MRSTDLQCLEKLRVSVEDNPVLGTLDVHVTMPIRGQDDLQNHAYRVLWRTALEDAIDPYNLLAQVVIHLLASVVRDALAGRGA